MEGPCKFLVIVVADWMVVVAVLGLINDASIDPIGLKSI